MGKGTYLTKRADRKCRLAISSAEESMGDSIDPEEGDTDSSVILGPTASIIVGGPIDIDDSPDRQRAQVARFPDVKKVANTV